MGTHTYSVAGDSTLAVAGKRFIDSTATYGTVVVHFTINDTSVLADGFVHITIPVAPAALFVADGDGVGLNIASDGTVITDSYAWQTTTAAGGSGPSVTLNWVAVTSEAKNG